MANLEAWSSVPPALPHPDGSYVEELFRARYLEMVRLAGLPSRRREAGSWFRRPPRPPWWPWCWGSRRE